MKLTPFVSFSSSEEYQATAAEGQAKTGRYMFYHGLWNFTNHSITIPEDKQRVKEETTLAGDPTIFTSLEILQKVLANGSRDEIENLHISAETNNDMLPICFIPNTKKTLQLVDSVYENSDSMTGRPIINVGLSKCGSSSLFEFFNCGERDGNNSRRYKASHGREGSCIAAAVMEGLPPLQGCIETRNKDVLLEINIQEPKSKQCWYPQVSFLDEIHDEFPNATFILNFRPIYDWIRSTYYWSDFVSRFTKCRNNIPGLIMKQRKPRLSYTDLATFYCNHVKHIRRFVQQYPTHRLIELDLYNTNQTSDIMSKLFRIPRNCWGKHNANQYLAQRLAEARNYTSNERSDV